MDDLGNRTTVNLRSRANQVYAADTPNITNRYTAVAGQPPSPPNRQRSSVNTVIRTIGVFILVMHQGGVADTPLGYEEIRSAIDVSWKARYELLNSSTGIAYFSIQRSVEPWDERGIQTLKEKLSDQGVNPEKVNAYKGEGSWTTTWFKKGPNNRCDVVVEPP